MTYVYQIIVINLIPLKQVPQKVSYFHQNIPSTHTFQFHVHRDFE